MGQTDQQREQVQQMLRDKAVERVKAWKYLTDNYETHGLSEADRDELLEILGLRTLDEAARTPYLYVGPAVSRRGLGSAVPKDLARRTPRQRGA